MFFGKMRTGNECTYWQITPGVTCFPSVIGTRNGLTPKFYPSLRSLANTTAIAGTPRGLVGGMTLLVLDAHLKP